MKLFHITMLGMTLAFALNVAGESEDFRERNLRGFGRVSAEFFEGNGESTLTVRLGNTDSANLLQAKFASDLTATVGKVIPKIVGGFHAYELPDGSLVASLVHKATLQVFCARTEAELVKKMAHWKPTTANTRSSAKIPMYLDGYDQYAFRFYYRPGELPPGGKADSYDPAQEFDFAAKLGNLGFIFWAETHNADFAAGLFNENTWNWAYRLAKARNLPIILNTSFSSNPSVSNAFRGETSQKAPHFSGSYHSVGEPYQGGTGSVSWGSENARRAELQQLQKIMRKYALEDQVIEILEPHGELNHGNYTVFLEYGPVADRSFRAFLKERYGTCDAVSKRYFGAPGKIKNWNEVRLPEVAEFSGWNDRALDLSGPWRLAYLTLKPGQRTPGAAGVNGDWKFEAEPAPAEFYAPGFDDSKLPLIRQMPGSDQSMLLPKQPAVARRKFTLPSKPEGRFWLYLWDLNQGTGDTLEVHLNGKKIAADTIRHNQPHWGVYEVSDALAAGENLLAVRLPKGAICYRVYLSREAPKAYPYLADGWNARWVDFSDWQGWSRNRAVEMGISTIREVEPNKPIVSMAPDQYVNQLREIARKYGARFHNTGYMSGFYAEYLPMLMRGAGLPFSLEPGGPAKTLDEFKHQTGLYMISGLNAVHYFIHVGSIYWNEPIRGYFEQILPALRLLGRQHQQRSDVAELFDSDISALLGYPWMADGNVAYPSGYWSWRFSETLVRDYPLDGLIPADFGNHLADRYRVIIDANNTVMRPETIAGITAWVKNGGVFIAMPQTGRHTPEAADSWPARELTGFTVKSISRYGEGNKPEKQESYSLVKEQNIFDPVAFQREMRGDGVKLEGGADTETLWRWQDGTTAIGMRKLGKGAVITVGARLPYYEESTRRILVELLKWTKAEPLALVAERPLHPRHYVSNNGLYDVWVLWNTDAKKSVPYKFVFRDGKARALTDILTGKPGAATGELPPKEFKIMTSLRENPAQAPGEWFRVQYNYWQGTDRPPVKVEHVALDGADFMAHTLPLDGVWEVRDLSATASVATEFAERRNWRKIELGAWLKDTEVKGDRFLLRKEVVIPKSWTHGAIHFWATSQYLSGFVGGSVRVYLNGEEIAAPPAGQGLPHLPLKVKAGDRVVFGLLIENRHPRVYGLRGVCFLSYIPTPTRALDLAGDWEVWRGINAPSALVRAQPGLADGNIRRREVKLPVLGAESRVFLYVEGEPDILGAMINGHYVRRHHHRIGGITYLDITPWVKSGTDNEIMIVNWDTNPTARSRTKIINLYIYDKK